MHAIPIRHNPIHYYIAEKPDSIHSYPTDSCLWINFSTQCTHNLGKYILCIYYLFTKYRVLLKYSCLLILVHILILWNVTKNDKYCSKRKMEIYIPYAIIKTVITWQNETRRLGLVSIMRANIQESFPVLTSTSKIKSII